MKGLGVGGRGLGVGDGGSQRQNRDVKVNDRARGSMFFPTFIVQLPNIAVDFPKTSLRPTYSSRFVVLECEDVVCGNQCASLGVMSWDNCRVGAGWMGWGSNAGASGSRVLSCGCEDRDE